MDFELGHIMNLKELQSYQNIFFESQRIYGICYDAQGHRITRLSMGEQERNELYARVGKEMLFEEFDDVKRQVFLDYKELRCASELEEMSYVGLPILHNEKLYGVWVVLYVEDNSQSKLERRVDNEKLNEVCELLSVLSQKFIAASFSTAFAMEELEKTKQTEKNMEEEFRRNMAFTSIVQLLEEDQRFEDTVEIVLTIVGEFLEIDSVVLVKVDGQHEGSEIVGEWIANEEVKPFAKRMTARGMDYWRRYNGSLTVFSTGDDNPELERICSEYGGKAFIATPIFINGRCAMFHICISDEDHVWDSATIRFVTDVSKMIQSILYKRITQNSLVSSYTALKEVLDNIGSEICVIDKKTKEILFCNEIVKKMCHSDMVGRKCSDYNNTCTHSDCASCPSMAGRSFFEEKYSSRRGAWYEVKFNDITWVDGRVVSLCNVTDVTEKKKYQKRIEFQANNDFLTGLYNRMRCEEDLELCIRNTEMEKAQGALLFMDLDNFKHINDGLGHQYGDILLKTISMGIQQIPGIEDHCYRVGGDEFIIIIEPYVFKDLERILEDLKRMFSKPWYLNDNEYYCTMSMGIVQFPKDGADVNSLIRKADIAMYGAKKSGKNRYEYYSRGEDISMVEKLDIEKNMRSAVAIGCNEFEIYIQPIVDAETEKCIGGEALIRWNSGRLGMLTPGEFIPLAEHLGLITPIGEYVLRQACMTNRYWSDRGVDFHINVNLSVVQLLQNNVVETIENVIRVSGVKPENLVLEVTESLAINDMTRMKKIIRSIKKMGVKIALDDFGTGYSSLNYIKQMDLDIIKVDRTFIKDIMEDDYAQAFVKLITDLSQKLNVQVCVEGVEEREQLDILQKMNVSMIQGYYFGKPMPISEFEEKYIFR